MKRFIKDFKEATIALFMFQPYTIYNRAVEICLSILAWILFIGSLLIMDYLLITNYQGIKIILKYTSITIYQWVEDFGPLDYFNPFY